MDELVQLWKKKTSTNKEDICPLREIGKIPPHFTVFKSYSRLSGEIWEMFGYGSPESLPSNTENCPVVGFVLGCQLGITRVIFSHVTFVVRSALPRGNYHPIKQQTRSPNAGLMLVHRLGRWTNIKPALIQRAVYAGKLIARQRQFADRVSFVIIIFAEDSVRISSTAVFK